MDNSFGEITYSSPHPRLRQITAFGYGIGLVVMLLLIVVQIGLAGSGAPLLCGTALFTLVLIYPLLLGTVLYPEITVSAEGLYLKPMLWRRSNLLHWDDLQHMTPHPFLMNPNLILGRLLHGKDYRPPEGMAIILSGNAPVSPLYRLFSLMLAGTTGNGPAFAISSTTHRDYAELRDLLTTKIKSPH